MAPASLSRKQQIQVAPGSRPPLLRRAAFNGWDRAGNEEGESLPGHVGVDLPSPAPEARPRVWKTPQVERREACVLAEHAAPPQGAMNCQAPFGAPLPHACEGKGNEGGPRAHQQTGTMNHACMDGAVENEI